jgi:hypothetical protein
MKGYFSEYFKVSPEQLQRYGAFNVSLVTDLPLFIDPFLLFNSKKSNYQELHQEIIKYLTFLREKSDSGHLVLNLHPLACQPYTDSHCIVRLGTEAIRNQRLAMKRL